MGRFFRIFFCGFLRRSSRFRTFFFGVVRVRGVFVVIGVKGREGRSVSYFRN